MLKVVIPSDQDSTTLSIDGREVKLTNLRKVFWKELNLTKGDLLRYYVQVAPFLIPHVKDRAMVMKRYPNGAGSDFFYMKRAPSPRPDWIQLCSIPHGPENIIDFPMVQDLPALLWLINLGCIDLNPWYSRCDDTDRPDFLHFDLDPTPGATFALICEAALIVRDTLASMKIACYPKTTGSRGIHIYIPIQRGPTQKEVWTFAKNFAIFLDANYPKIMTAQYRIAKRPPKHVLVDYNQNAWGRTLSSIYSVRPTPKATVSTPLTWEEVEKRVDLEDFRIDNVPQRLKQVGDLWKPVLAKKRFDLMRYSI